MNISLHHSLKAIGLAMALGAASLAHSAPAVWDAQAQAQGEQSYQTYRAVVLGDSSARVVREAKPDAPRFVPGPYARYLMNNGMSQGQAVATASGIGEEPTWQAVVNTPKPQLSSYQIYERTVLGRTLPSVSEPASQVVQSK